MSPIKPGEWIRREYLNLLRSSRLPRELVWQLRQSSGSSTGGLLILKNRRKEDIKSACVLKVRENRPQIFRRFGLHATTLMNSRQPFTNATTFGDHNSEQDSPIPASFLSLQQAQEELERIAIRLVQVLTLKTQQ